MEDQIFSQDFISRAPISLLILAMISTQDSTVTNMLYTEVHNRLSESGMNFETQEIFIEDEKDTLYHHTKKPLILPWDLLDMGKETFSLFFDAIHYQDINNLFFSELILLRHMGICFEIELEHINRRISLYNSCSKNSDMSLQQLKRAHNLIERLSKREYEDIFRYLYDIDEDWVHHKSSLDEFVQNETIAMREVIYAVQASAMLGECVGYKSEEMQRILTKDDGKIILFPTKK